MRTTLTLDPDVAALVQDAVHRTRATFKDVVNDALRRGLAPGATPSDPAPYVVTPHVASLLPGVDVRRLHALADALEDDALSAHLDVPLLAAEP